MEHLLEARVEAADIVKSKGVKRIGPYRVTQTMGNTVSAALATFWHQRGEFSFPLHAQQAHIVLDQLEQIHWENKNYISWWR